MALTVHYKPSTADTTGRPSPAVWGDCPVSDILADPAYGIHYWDDFIDNGELMSGDDVTKYITGVTTNTTITGFQSQTVTINAYGYAQAAHAATDNSFAMLQLPGAIAHLGEGGPFWFECRVRKSSIADNAIALFIGLAAQNKDASSTTVLYNDCGYMQKNDYVGFLVSQGDGDAIKFEYNVGAGTKATPIAACDIDGAGDITLPAATWVKLGFKYSPNAVPEKALSVYANGVEQGTGVTKAVVEASTVVFPTDEMLSPIWVTKLGGATASLTCDLDWWRYAQVFNTP